MRPSGTSILVVVYIYRYISVYIGMYLDNGSKRDGDALRELLGVGNLVDSEAHKPRRSVAVINHPVLRRGLYIGIYDDMYR